MEIISDAKEVTAKKQHSCNYCGLKIEPKEKYLKSVNKHDGLVYTWKSHLKCQGIASKLKMFDWADEGVTQMFFQESICEEYREIMLKKMQDEKWSYPKFSDMLLYVIMHHELI